MWLRGKVLHFVLIIPLFALYDKNLVTIFTLVYMWYNVAMKQQNLVSNFHIPCLSILNLFLSTDKKFSVKNCFLHTRTYFHKTKDQNLIYFLPRLGLDFSKKSLSQFKGLCQNGQPDSAKNRQKIVKIWTLSLVSRQSTYNQTFDVCRRNSIRSCYHEGFMKKY